MVNTLSCGNQENDLESSSLSAFFENSTRRDPNEFEHSIVANIKGCSAFFVRNSQNKNFLISARHCVGMAITNWCSSDGVLTKSVGGDGRCSRVVAADLDHDVAMIEADFPFVAGAERSLRLAAFTPKQNTRMFMVGFPADQYRNAKITTTENCWVMSTGNHASPHTTMRDLSSLHNCTTYGGNSGGPMIKEAANIALGLPFTYYPGDYTLRSSTNLGTAAYMAQMADFVRTHRDTLIREGVEIVETDPDAN